jgi:Uri superfamily endonuclease
MKGIYLLLININKNIDITIGRLNKIRFSKNKYIYVGSAQKNLEQRIKRHFRKNKFWHIDYLLVNKAAKIEEVFYKKSNRSGECKNCPIFFMPL